MSLTSSVISYERAELEWNGDAVKRDVLEAAAVAIDFTMTKCVLRAREFHDYEDRTGYATASIQVLDLATAGPLSDLLDHVSGAWGSTADYSLYLEIGTSREWSGAPKAEERALMANGHMWAVPPPLPSGPHTDTIWIGHYLPGAEGTGPGRWKVPGTGPLMEPRMSMRPAAAEEYPLLAERIALAYQGERLV